MIKKLLTWSAIILSGLSFFIIVGRYKLDFRIWLLVSFAPYMLLSVIALRVRSGLFKAMLLPFLVFYGAGALVSIPFEPQYAYALVSAVVMLLFAAYFLLTQVMRLRFIRILAGLVLGFILFFALKYYQKHYMDGTRMREVVHIEKRMLFK